MNQTISINKYLPVALLYFFFNGFLLPIGLLYTTILTPFFLIWLYKFPSFKYVWLFFIIMIPFVIIHFLNGVNIIYYAKSFLLLFSAYVFCLAFYQFLKECKSLRTIYKKILLINIVFVTLALIALALPALKNWFWYSNEITTGVKSVRLKMLTYEPSYYSTLFVPIALYYYLKMIILKLPNPVTTFIILTIPLLLSLSFGIIFGLILSLIFILLWNAKFIFPNKNIPVYIIIGSIVFLLLLVFIVQLFPDNVFVVRIANVFSGKDTSFKGRTFDSFSLSWEIASKKSILFGCGLGQTKELGLELFKEFYKNSAYTVNDIGIPNSVADTLATLGIAGVSIRFFLEFYFFFRTKVYNNYYRLGLFLFIFIYQFTGSFITNIAEYVIWILAFYPGVFKEFDKATIRQQYQREDAYHKLAI